MKKLCMMVIAGSVFFGLCASVARALPPFKKAFDDRYVKTSSSEEFKTAFKAASCNTCHVSGKNKKIRNPYGEALSKIIGGDAKKRMEAAKEKGEDAEKAEMKKLLDQLNDAFTKVEEEKSPSGPTYGELIKSGKLPFSK